MKLLTKLEMLVWIIPQTQEEYKTHDHSIEQENSTFIAAVKLDLCSTFFINVGEAVSSVHLK